MMRHRLTGGLQGKTIQDFRVRIYPLQHRRGCEKCPVTAILSTEGTVGTARGVGGAENGCRQREVDGYSMKGAWCVSVCVHYYHIFLCVLAICNLHHLLTKIQT